MDNNTYFQGKRSTKLLRNFKNYLQKLNVKQLIKQEPLSCKLLT